VPKSSELSSNEQLIISTDSLSIESTFLLHFSLNTFPYSIGECKWVGQDSIECFAYNKYTQIIDTLLGVFSKNRSLELISVQKKVIFRASFKENGNGEGVLSTNTKAFFTNIYISKFIQDGVENHFIDSLVSNTNNKKKIDFQIILPKFKYSSAAKEKIFSQVTTLSQEYVQTYIDSLQRSDILFLKIRTTCTLLGTKLCTYSFSIENNIDVRNPLFGITFMLSNGTLVTTDVVNESLRTNFLPQFFSEFKALYKTNDTIIPSTKYVLFSVNEITYYSTLKNRIKPPFVVPLIILRKYINPSSMLETVLKEQQLFAH